MRKRSLPDPCPDVTSGWINVPSITESSLNAHFWYEGLIKIFFGGGGGFFFKKKNYANKLADVCCIVQQVKLCIKTLKHLPFFFTVNGTYLNCFGMEIQQKLKCFLNLCSFCILWDNIPVF